MPTIPLFGTGFYSKSAQVTRQQRTNLYAEVQKDNDKSPLVFYPTPGLTIYENFPPNPSRGMISVPQPGVSGDYLFTVHGNAIWTVSPAVVATLVGTIKTSAGFVSAAWNGTQLVWVDGQDGWMFTPGGAGFQELRVLDPDFPTSPGSVCFLNGYFIVQQNGSGRFYWSALQNGGSWNALDFATAEASPDNLIRCEADYGQLYLMGQRTTEVWVASGDANVWIRAGGAVAEWGCVAQQSVAKFDVGLIFLAQNRLGETQVIRLSGTQADPVTDSEVANAINVETSTSLQGATGFSYVIDGHVFYQLNVVSRSFLYDATSGVWSYVTTGLVGGRHIAERRAALSQDPFVSSYNTGEIFRLDKTVYTDNGTPIIREIVSRHVNNSYERTTVWSLQLDMDTGDTPLLSGQGSDPQVMLQVSKDGGRTWGFELWRRIGKQGEYRFPRVLWKRLGQARDWVFKFRVTDPIKTVFIGATMDIDG